MDWGYSNDPTSLIAMYKYNDSYIFDELIYQKGL
jgi:phage terminase large subunit